MILVRAQRSLDFKVLGLAAALNFLYAYNSYVQGETLDETIRFTDRLGALTELPDDVTAIIEKYHISESSDMEEIVLVKKAEDEVARLEEWVTDYCNKMIDDINENLADQLS